MVYGLCLSYLVWNIVENMDLLHKILSSVIWVGNLLLLNDFFFLIDKKESTYICNCFYVYNYLLFFIIK